MNRKTRVIVVDDSALVRSLLAEIINRQPDMECIGTANDPLVAREMIREKNPDVITLDIEMPKMDGLALTRKVKESSLLKHIPTIVFSSIVAEDIKRKAQSVGADAQISKPEISLLVETVTRLLKAQG